MATGKRYDDTFKTQIAKRASSEDPKALAEEIGVSYYTVLEWRKNFTPKKHTIKRKTFTRNTRVSSNGQTTKVLEAENKGLREEVQRLKGLLLEEILRSRGA